MSAGSLAEIVREIEVTNPGGEPIRFVEPPADAGATPKRAVPAGALPARPRLARLRRPETAVPAIIPELAQPAKPVVPVAGPSVPRTPPEAKKPSEPAKDTKGKELPAGLIEQRLIDLPLPPL